MEIAPDIVGGETDEVSPENAPPEVPDSKEEFEHRVLRLMAMMKDDPDVRDRIIAEIYVNIASAETGIRVISETIQTQGVAGLMRGAFRKG